MYLVLSAEFGGKGECQENRPDPCVEEPK